MRGSKVAIIGGGAAGFFTAVNLAENCPQADITIYEGSTKILSKVLVSGGGRCNVTNQISEPVELSKNYPRGQKFLISVFEKFSSNDTKKWFEERGIPLKTENDGRVFPKSNSSQSIYNCLTQQAVRLGVKLEKSKRLWDFKSNPNGWRLSFSDNQVIDTDYLVLASGSNNKMYKLFANKGIVITPPLPSLFTFNAENHESMIDLAGVSVPMGSAQIKEVSNSKQTGPILVTHWGYSAPAILKLSAWQARTLAELDYKFTLQLNWSDKTSEELRNEIQLLVENLPKGKVISWKGHNVSKRLWLHIFEKSELREFTNWSEIGKKGIKRLLNNICNFEVRINGKSIFKEEFVTCGGIALDEVNHNTLEINKLNQVYVAGEVLDIDAITGGFNFQAAWSEAHLISQAISEKIRSHSSQ